jgi:dihydrodipicolinate synthase/N-acetylneuraminate lyase
MTSPAHPTAWLAGCIPDLPTPFDEKGAVDLKAFARLCERQVAAGMSALVVCDVAGEASTLSAARESPAALKYVLSLLGLMEPTVRLPLVELAEPAKAAIARAVAGLCDEDLLAAAEA